MIFYIRNNTYFCAEFFEFMTEEQIKTMRIFEVRVHQILQLCDRLKDENALLNSQLEEQRIVIGSLNENYSRLKNKYDNLKIAQVIYASRGDFKATKDRLKDLVREVDKCITLLSK